MWSAATASSEEAVEVAAWDVPLGQPDAPECRPTDIDVTVMAEHGIDLLLALIRPPQRGRVIQLPATQLLAVPPLAPLPEPAPVPAPVPVQLIAEPRVVMAAGPAPASWARPVPALQAARRAASWMLLLSLGLVLGPGIPPTPGEPPTRAPAPALFAEPALWPGGPSSLPQPPGASPLFIAWQVGSSGEKLASPLHPPQSGSGADKPPASIAEATLPQDEPDVKTPVKKTGLGPVKRTVAAAAAAMALGCPTTHVRPPPEPMECPPGARENMEKLGLKRGEAGLFAFESHQGVPAFIPVKEGWTSFRAEEQWPVKKVPWIERVSGKVLFGDRVYGRLTQATLSDGTTLRVCMELFDRSKDFKRGLICEPTSSPDTVKAGSLVGVGPVDHFE
jgi:hypothetical protein